MVGQTASGSFEPRKRGTPALLWFVQEGSFDWVSVSLRSDLDSGCLAQFQPAMLDNGVSLANRETQAFSHVLLDADFCDPVGQDGIADLRNEISYVD